jgi:hypothetical protein
MVCVPAPLAPEIFDITGNDERYFHLVRSERSHCNWTAWDLCGSPLIRCRRALATGSPRMLTIAGWLCATALVARPAAKTAQPSTAQQRLGSRSKSAAAGGSPDWACRPRFDRSFRLTRSQHRPGAAVSGLRVTSSRFAARWSQLESSIPPKASGQPDFAEVGSRGCRIATAVSALKSAFVPA